MRIRENKNLKDKNIKKIKRQVSIITVFLWIFLVATMVTIIAGNVRNTNAYGSESIQVGSSGSYTWTERVIYHANYPNASDYDIWTVDYKIRSGVTSTMYNTKSFSEIGFTEPIGYKSKYGWYDSPSGGKAVNSLNFNKNNAGKTTHLYAQYNESNVADEAINLGRSGSYNWNERIVYHANYPDSGDNDVWKVNYYIISSITSRIETAKSYNEIGFTVPEGYKLKSDWYDSPSGGEPVSSLNFNKNNAGKTTHLYAQYEKNQFKLIYNVNGGYSDGPLPSNEYTDDSGNISLTDVEVKRSGYKFLGWSTDRNGKGKRYSPGERIVLTKDTRLYALWGPMDPEREKLNHLLGDFVKIKCISNYNHYDKDKYYNIMEELDEYVAKIGEVRYSEEKGLYLCDIELDGRMYCEIYDFEVSEKGEKHVLDSLESPYKYLTLYYDDTRLDWKPLDNTELPIEFKVRCNHDKYFGKYKVTHEYYLKDKNSNLNLEKTITEEKFIMFDSEEGKKVGISNEEETVDVEIEKKPYCDIDNVKYIYEYYENSENVTILPGETKEITLKYIREEENETKIKVEKVWEDNNNEYGKRPEKVVLQIKIGEEIISEMEASEENNWSYEFVVPKYGKDGNEIEYVVDEKETDVNYEKRIDGYKVINKYRVEEEKNEDKENNNDIIKNEENVDTSDINIWMYVGVAIASIVVIVVVIILVKKNNKK